MFKFSSCIRQQQRFIRSNASQEPTRKFTAQITRAHTWEEACIVFNEAMKFVVPTIVPSTLSSTTITATSKNVTSENQNKSSSFDKRQQLHQYWLRALLRRCGRSDWKVCLNVYSKLWDESASSSSSSLSLSSSHSSSISKNILCSDSTRAAVAYGTLVNWKLSLAFSLSTPNLIDSELKPLGLTSVFPQLPLPFVGTENSSSEVLPVFDTALRGASQAGAWKICLDLFQKSGLRSDLRYKDCVTVSSPSNRHHQIGSSVLVFARIALSTMVALVSYQQKNALTPSSSCASIQQQQQQEESFLSFAERLYASFNREIRRIDIPSNAEFSLMHLRLHTSYCFILNNAGKWERALQVCQASPWEIQETPDESFPTEDVVGLVSKALSETRWSIILRSLGNMRNAAGVDRGEVDADTNELRQGNKSLDNVERHRAAVNVAEYVIRLRHGEKQARSSQQVAGGNSAKKRNFYFQQRQQRTVRCAISPRALLWERTFCIEAFKKNDSSSDSSESALSRAQQRERAVDTWYLSIVDHLENPRRTEALRMRCTLSLADVLRSDHPHDQRQQHLQAKQQLQQQQQQQQLQEEQTTGTTNKTPSSTLLSQFEVYPGEEHDRQQLEDNQREFSPFSSSWKAALHAFGRGFENEIAVVSQADENRVWLLPILCVVAESPSCPPEVARRSLERALEILAKMEASSSADVVHADSSDGYLSLVRSLVYRKKFRFQPVPSSKIRSIFYKSDETRRTSSFSSSTSPFGGRAAEDDDEKKVENFELVSSPRFRDAPWVFFSQIALCIEMRAPCVDHHELAQRWMLALQAFEKWKAHELLNFREREKLLVGNVLLSSSKEEKRDAKRKLLLDVNDLEDAFEDLDFGNSSPSGSMNSVVGSNNHLSSNSSSYSRDSVLFDRAASSSSYFYYHRFFDDQDISCSSAMESLKSWLESHKLHEVASEHLSSLLPSDNAVLDTIVSEQISRHHQPHSQTRCHSATSVLDLKNKICTEVMSVNGKNEVQDSLQRSLLKCAVDSPSSSDLSLLLQTAAALRKSSMSSFSSSSSASCSQQQQQQHPSFVPSPESWTKFMISQAMKSGGSWQHAHFLFLRSLHSLSLRQQCEFVEFELERLLKNEEDDVSNTNCDGKSLSSTSSSRPVSTALLAVAIGIVPKLANTSRQQRGELKKSEDRCLTYAARVGVSSFLSCGMWRSALNFASSTLNLRKKTKTSPFLDRNGDDDENFKMMLTELHSHQKIPENIVTRLLK